MAHNHYDWTTSRRLSDWHLEGMGELRLTDAGELLVRTYNCGPGRRATNVWLRNFELPPAYHIRWRFRSDAAAGNAMCIFNARPLLLTHLFQDTRPEARYCDLASWRKMVAYTCGFHRGVAGNPSVLRKIGGEVPLEWGMVTDEMPAWKEMDRITRLDTAQEPITAADRGRWHDFAIERLAGRIRYIVNGQMVHDLADTGQYPYHTTPLVGGHCGFRNFGGPADDYYANITVETIEEDAPGTLHDSGFSNDRVSSGAGCPVSAATIRPTWM